MFYLLWLLSLTGSLFAVPPGADQILARTRESVPLVRVSLGERTRSGAGLLVGPRQVLTCAHVLQDGKEFLVQFPRGETIQASVLRQDRDLDLALLSLAKPAPSRPVQLHAIPVRQGQSVLLLGHPRGLPWTAYRGLVSATGRAVLVGKLPMAPLIQLDAGVNSGCSGGPVLNQQGQVVGLVLAVHTELQHVGFALPVGQVLPFLAGNH